MALTSNAKETVSIHTMNFTSKYLFENKRTNITFEMDFSDFEFERNERERECVLVFLFLSSEEDLK